MKREKEAAFSVVVAMERLIIAHDALKEGSLSFNDYQRLKDDLALSLVGTGTALMQRS